MIGSNVKATDQISGINLVLLISKHNQSNTKKMTDACARLDQYRIVRKIGTGYSADVYEAELAERKFAVKIFKDDTCDFAEN